MKTAVIFQPYFFPYIGYYQLAKFADVWVIFDETQYIDKGWIARNRILHSDVSKNWTFINKIENFFNLNTANFITG